ncbi:MAG: diguanylate cyclase [Mariniblastus sp.]|jgi:diguanylate cyclase
MFPQEMSSIIFIGIWSLTSVAVGLMSGFFIGRTYTLANEPKRLKSDRESTLTALLTVMNSTDRLNEDVDSHNVALRNAQQELAQIDTEDQFADLQSKLMMNITRVVQSNRKLENDLVVSKYKLETQAQELDRTRLEARTDPLCEVGNRKAVDEAFQFMVSRYHSEQVSFGVMLIDIDHFKRINDSFGHQAGDEVLTSIAKALQECVRPEDFVGRLGGDEFIILLDGLTEQNADLVGARIRSTIELYGFSINSSGQSTVVTMSMGLAVVAASDDAKRLYERADQALYRSKQLGRNRLYTITDSNEEFESTPQKEGHEDSLTSYEDFKASFVESNLGD